MVDRDKRLRWRNVLNVSHSHCSAPPRIQDLSHSRRSQPVAYTDSAAVPSQYEVELGELALQAGTVMFLKRRDLGWEDDTVRANGLA